VAHRYAASWLTAFRLTLKRVKYIRYPAKGWAGCALIFWAGDAEATDPFPGLRHGLTFAVKGAAVERTDVVQTP
jgi:hypothetical protein